MSVDLPDYVLRPIEREDNEGVALVIRTVMPEFGASGPGFAINDPEVTAMCEAYQENRSAYFVITNGTRILGGAGVAPLVGGDGTICELRKMYILLEIRGKKFGEKLLEKCLVSAKAMRFSRCYLETLHTMVRAQKLYERYGFIRIPKPMGDTGHVSCNTWYIKNL